MVKLRFTITIILIWNALTLQSNVRVLVFDKLIEFLFQELSKTVDNIFENHSVKDSKSVHEETPSNLDTQSIETKDKKTKKEKSVKLKQKSKSKRKFKNSKTKRQQNQEQRKTKLKGKTKKQKKREKTKIKNIYKKKRKRKLKSERKKQKKMVNTKIRKKIIGEQEMDKKRILKRKKHAKKMTRKKKERKKKSKQKTKMRKNRKKKLNSKMSVSNNKKKSIEKQKSKKTKTNSFSKLKGNEMNDSLSDDIKVNQTEFLNENMNDEEQRSNILAIGDEEKVSDYENLDLPNTKASSDYHEEAAAIELLEKLLESERQARNIQGSQEDTTLYSVQGGYDDIVGNGENMDTYHNNYQQDTTSEKPLRNNKKRKKPKNKRKNDKRKKATKKPKCSWFKRRRQEVVNSYRNFKRQNCLNRRQKSSLSYDTMKLLYKQLFDITKASNIVAEHIADYKTFIESVEKFLTVNPICYTNLQWNHVIIKVK